MQDQRILVVVLFRGVAEIVATGDDRLAVDDDDLVVHGVAVAVHDDLRALPREEIIKTMRVDKKKNAKAIRFALPAEIGRVELVEVTDLEEVIGKW